MTQTVLDLSQDFAAAMTRIGFFEPAPHLAVAVSGGADSMALLLLAKSWSEARGGGVTALTVDHGLRAASNAEAAVVARWCHDRAISHATLIWEGAKPEHALQAKARVARYALLENWCREAGVIHLLLGHHRDDQVETIAMRAAMKSGPEGLAGMADIVERRDVRLLRPLLAMAKQDLLGWLQAQDQPWLEDPSNRDPRFERARLRMAIAPPQLRAAIEERGDIDRSAAGILARIAAIHPEGWVRMELAGLAGLRLGMVANVLRRAVMTVAGGIYPPRGSRLRECAAWAACRDGPSVRMLAGCRLVRGTSFLDIVRDGGDASRPAEALVGKEILWDRRFRVRLGQQGPNPPISVVAAGQNRGGRGLMDVARRAAFALPALQGVDGGVRLPHVLSGRGLPTLVSVQMFDVTFRPHLALGGAAFAGLQAVKLSSIFPVHADAAASPPHRPSKSLEPQ